MHACTGSSTVPPIALAIKALIAAALGGARLHVWLGATGEDGYHAGVALAAWAAPAQSASRSIVPKKSSVRR